MTKHVVSGELKAGECYDKTSAHWCGDENTTSGWKRSWGRGPEDTWLKVQEGRVGGRDPTLTHVVLGIVLGSTELANGGMALERHGTKICRGTRPDLCPSPNVPLHHPPSKAASQPRTHHLDAVSLRGSLSPSAASNQTKERSSTIAMRDGQNRNDSRQE